MVDRFFGSEADGLFQWFSFTDAVPGGTGHFTAIAADQPARAESDNARADLHEYFARLSAGGTRFTVRGIEVIGWDSATQFISLAPILFEYQKRDPNSPRTLVYYGRGKAAYHCPTDRFVAMSLTSVDETEWNRLFRIHFSTADSTE